MADLVEEVMSYVCIAHKEKAKKALEALLKEIGNGRD
jgi:hypothetical protein